MNMPFLIAKIILGGYWLVLAPALLLPLGIVLLNLKVVRGIIGYMELLLAVVFAALGVAFLTALNLREAVTILACVQAIAAAITLVAQNGKSFAGRLKNAPTLGDDHFDRSVVK